MKLAVVGGKLQGVETCYLAHQAGWEILLVDKAPSVPARGLCDVFACHDVVRQGEEVVRFIRHADLVVPALEDKAALASLSDICSRRGIPLAFDPEAYHITSSKRKSDSLFRSLSLPVPRPGPDCDLPVIVKPVESSGSRGVMKIVDQEHLTSFFLKNKRHEQQWVVQEFLEGPSYSLEVVGLGERASTLQTTGLEMDASYDCKRVVAPVDLPAPLDQAFGEMAKTLARRLSLQGVMDLEVVHHGGELKILEIDARLPSQTPTAVERSTGINILELLAEVFLHGRLPEVHLTRQRGVIYEHIRVDEHRLEVSGEHIMAGAGPLHREDGFFGVDTALTNFSSPDRPWVATLIVVGPDRDTAWEKRCDAVRTIMEVCGVSHYVDPDPNDTNNAKERRA
jgi:pyrrolysine biosynthesis protein PylC